MRAPRRAPTSRTASKLAVKEINAAGGILGRKIETTTGPDTQNNPGVAKGLATKAVDDDVFAVFGPVFSGSILVSMAETRKSRGAQLHWRRGRGDHQAGQPVHLPHQLHAGPRDAEGGALHREQPEGQDVALIFVNNDFGKGGRDVAHQGAQADWASRSWPTSPPTQNQVDFSAAVLKAKGTNADEVFGYTNEEEAARALRELRKQGVDQAARRRDRADQPEGDRAGR